MKYTINIYIYKLKELPKDATDADFRILRSKVGWTNNSIPYIACLVAKLVWVSAKTYINYKKRCYNMMILYITHLPTHKDITLKYRKLDMNSLKTVSYSDASFATIETSDD